MGLIALHSAHFSKIMKVLLGTTMSLRWRDDVVFTGWFAGGEVFRSGCTFTRGAGKFFIFNLAMKHTQFIISLKFKK